MVINSLVIMYVIIVNINNYFIKKALAKSDSRQVVLLTDDIEDIKDLSAEIIQTDEHIKYDSEQYHILKKKICDIRNNVLLVAKAAHMYMANRLLWECDNAKGVYYIDTDMPYEEEHKVTFKDKFLWDVQANKADSQSVMSGWFNSYNNQEFTKEELEEYVNNSREKLMPYMTKASSVLEVGIGSGMLAFQLAPLCKEYDGCDISDVVLDKLKQLAEEKEIDNITLYPYAADEIDNIPKKYNIILMSSVTEYFSGYNYLRKVVEKCIHSIEEKGVILFADVFDLAKKETYKRSVYRYALENQGVRYKRDFSHELFVPHEYWKDMANVFSDISRVIISDKLGTIRNEINAFRYDIILEIDKTNKKELCKNNLYKYQFGYRTI